MCTFCENNWKLNSNEVTAEKQLNDYAEILPWYGNIDEISKLPFGQWKEKGKSINCVLLESGEGAAWGNKTVSKYFPINYCPICGKFLGKTVEIKESTTK